MFGAIIGDMAGSVYEFGQIKKVRPICVKNLIEKESFFSDDTILTIAVLDSIINNTSYESNLKKYGLKFLSDVPKNIPYFKRMFSPNFEKWLKSNDVGTSVGNGAMMRVSPVGYLFDTEEDVIENAIAATTPSHNTQEAIESAKKVALAIFYARKGIGKAEILKKLNIELNFKPFEKFNYTCSETLDNCFYAAFTSNSFEESIKKVISFGGDTDTNACIVGSISEALFGIEPEIVCEAKKKLPAEFLTLLEQGYNKITPLRGKKK